MCSVLSSRWVRQPIIVLLVAALWILAAVSSEGKEEVEVITNWKDETSLYFNANKNLPALRVSSIADWYNDMNANFIGTLGKNRSRVVMWGSKAFNQQQRGLSSSSQLFDRKWESAALLPPIREGATAPNVVSTIAVDVFRAGHLDVLVQGSDGGIFFINGTDPQHIPHRVTVRASISAGVKVLKPSKAASGLVVPSGTEEVGSAEKNPRELAESGVEEVNVAFMYPESPQLSLAGVTNGHSGTPDLMFVNQLGQLVLLRLVIDKSPGDSSVTYEASLLVHEDISQGNREVLPFSLRVADVSGDCGAEVIYAVRDIPKSTLQIYAITPPPVATAPAASEPSAKPALLLTLEESSSVYHGDITITDIDGDGAPDIVVPLCKKPSHQQHATPSMVCEEATRVKVFFNTLTDLSKGCAHSRTDLSSSSPYAAAESVESALTAQVCGLSFSAKDSTDQSLFMPSSLETPLVLRSADFNNDRRMDLVVPSSYGPLILEHSAGSGGSDGEGARRVSFVCTPLDPRKAVTSKTEGAAAYRTSVPFFSDVAVPGRTDILLTHLGSSANDVATSTAVLSLYTNNAISDRNYFLLVSALHGGVKDAYGVPQPSSVHFMTWQDTHMKSHSKVITQHSHTQANALQSPRVQVGLGETFSYVQGYTVGVAVGNTVYQHRWPSYLIPNAQLFAIVDPLTHPSSWSLQLYLPTSQYTTLLIIALCVSLVVVGLPIVILRWKEMRDDHAEWKLR